MEQAHGYINKLEGFMKYLNRTYIGGGVCFLLIAISPISASALSKGSCSFNYNVTKWDSFWTDDPEGPGTNTIYVNCCKTDLSAFYWIKTSSSYAPSCKSASLFLSSSNSCSNTTPVLSSPVSYNGNNNIAGIRTVFTTSLPCTLK